MLNTKLLVLLAVLVLLGTLFIDRVMASAVEVPETNQLPTQLFDSPAEASVGTGITVTIGR